MPHPSSGLPEGRASNPNPPSYLTLHRVGFTWQTCRHASGALLPHPFTLAVEPEVYETSEPSPAVCFLWHLPAGFPDWALPSTLLFGVRTFLPAILCPGDMMQISTDVCFVSPDWQGISRRRGGRSACNYDSTSIPEKNVAPFLTPSRSLGL